MATFDQWQQVYCISQQSNLIGSYDPNAQDSKDSAGWLQTQLQNFYKAYNDQMGTWSTVWGPAVYEQDQLFNKTADNVMYVAANQDPENPMVVVAVAGTSGKSLNDLLLQDNAVDKTVEWAAAFAELPGNMKPVELNPYLSAGTQLGVHNLLGMTDVTTTKKSLIDFLKSAANKKTTLIFAGHSLGGALAPTLALALFNSDGGVLRKSDWANVRFYTTAGPTPGNSDLSSYMEREFPPTAPPQPDSYKCWNRNVANSLDAVPQGWVVDLMGRQTELYQHVDKPWPPTDKAPIFDKPLKEIIDNNVQLSLNGAAYRPDGAPPAGAYTRLSHQILQGTQYTDTTSFDTDKYRMYPMPVDSSRTWFYQMVYQHLNAYDILFGVTSVSPQKPAPQQ